MGLLRDNTQRQRESPDEKAQRRQQEQSGQMTQKAAVEEALKQASEGDMNELLDALTTLDFESEEYADLHTELQPHLSKHIATTNYRDKDRDGLAVSNKALAERVILEREHGRLVDEDMLEVAQRVDGRPDKRAKQRLTDAEKRAVRATIGEGRTAMQLKSIDNELVAMIAETHIESLTTVTNDGSGDSGGRLDSAINKVF